MDECKKRHEDSLNAADPNMIRMPLWLIEKCKLIDRKLEKKGKTGKQITNMHVNEAKKRKRTQMYMQEAEKEFRDDKL